MVPDMPQANPRSRRSDAPWKQKYHDHEQKDSYSTAWVVAPIPAMGPPRQDTEQGQNQYHGQNDSEHGRLLLPAPAREYSLQVRGSGHPKY
jgi:hypothetical protein